MPVAVFEETHGVEAELFGHIEAINADNALLRTALTKVSEQSDDPDARAWAIEALENDDAA
jgi:hypothetical protein